MPQTRTSSAKRQKKNRKARGTGRLSGTALLRLLTSVVTASAAMTISTSERRGCGRSMRQALADSQTWSGRGKAPAWMQAHLEDGGEKDDLLINSAPQQLIAAE